MGGTRGTGPNPERFFEIDMLRGIAVAMMIVYHAAFDLSYFGGSGFVSESFFWWAFARLTASIFIFIAGVSLAISYARAERTGNALFRKYASRGLKIFGIGMIITAVTYLYAHDQFVVFGILHFIGLSVILAYPFLKAGTSNKTLLAMSAVMLALGMLLKEARVGTPLFLWLGLMPGGFASLDYFPLIPWFGIVLLGLVFGRALYPGGKRKFRVRNDLNEWRSAKGLCFMGRNSLLIYVVHQPILLFLMREIAVM